MIQRSTIPREPPFHIESDGKPMGETACAMLSRVLFWTEEAAILSRKHGGLAG